MPVRIEEEKGDIRKIISQPEGYSKVPDQYLIITDRVIDEESDTSRKRIFLPVLITQYDMASPFHCVFKIIFSLDEHTPKIGRPEERRKPYHSYTANILGRSVEHILFEDTVSKATSNFRRLPPFQDIEQYRMLNLFCPRWVETRDIVERLQ